MTYTYDFYFGKTDSSTGLKIVEMVRHGEGTFGEFGEQRHDISWFSEDGRKRLFQEMEEDMTDRMCK